MQEHFDQMGHDISLLPQTIWYINNHTGSTITLLAKQQHRLEEQSGLIVQEVLPPTRRHNLWQDDDRQTAFRLTPVRLFEVREERTDHRTIRRFQHHQRDIEAPGLPTLPEALGRRRIHVHHRSEERRV